MSNIPENACSASSLVDEVCLQRVQYEFTYGNIDCECYQPCKEMTYLPKVTTSKVNDYYFNLLHQYRKKVSSLCSRDTHLLTLNIYIDSPYYEIIEETPAYTFDTLLSNIGGSLGLFIGVSVISIVEVIEFFVDIFLTSIRSRRGRIRDADGKGQTTVMYPDDVCQGCVTPQALERLKREMAKETERDIQALRREMAQEKERDRAQLEKDMALQKEELTKEMARVREMSEKDLEAYLDASVDRIIGVSSENKSKDDSAGWAKQAFNALFLKR
ncbi:uncharacterized protein [Macrobrachium rosenbergii]|uniref:uncharacterized protein n=1 Tax=Macrobrachium rosenbergii TaxID=79674 RepID=UPI0034D64087